MTSVARWRRLVLTATVLVAACAGPSSAAPSPTSGTPPVSPTVAQATATVVPTSKAQFPSGLYIVRPALDHPGGTIELLESVAPLPTTLEVRGIGFDVSADLFVSTTFDAVVLTRPNGSVQQLRPTGLSALGRPSLSPDSKSVFLQATESRFDPAAGPNRPMDDTVYIVDLTTGAFRRIGDKPAAGDPSTQSEQPVYFPSGDRVAYWAAQNGCLVVKVRDAATAKDLFTIRRDGVTGCYQPQRGILDGPRFHVAVSHDSSRILVPGQMQLYDAANGALVTDLHQRVLDGLAAAGYRPDSRFPGAAMAGTFPLSATFAADDRSIVFDGAVEKDGTFGVLLCRINVDGTSFAVLRPPVPTTPLFSNNHNFSQVLPHWLAAR